MPKKVAPPPSKRRKEEEEEDIDEEDFEGLLNGNDGSDDEEQNQDDIDEEEFEKELAALKRVQQPKKPIVYKEDEMLQILEDIKVKVPGGGDLPWEESLVISTADPLVVEDVHDDIERETKFYQLSLEAANRAVNLLNKHKISFRRPTDYFAEMLKSDEQMRRIKGQLLVEKESIEEAEEKRRQRDMKKYGKKVQQEREKEKQQKKKGEMEAVKKWRKAREQGSAGADEFPIELENPIENESVKSKKLNGKPQPASSNNNNASKSPFNKKRKADDDDENGQKKKKGKMTKREYKNEKYGVKGPKKGDRKNSSKSSRDMSDFNPRVHQNKNEPGRKKPGFGKKPHRPGKARRQQGRK